MVAVDEGLCLKKIMLVSNWIRCRHVFCVIDRYRLGSERWEERDPYHEEGPDGVVEEDDGGGHQHGETDELVELLRGEQLAFAFIRGAIRIASKIEIVTWRHWRRRTKLGGEN